jgi:hypothetical protein
VQNTNYDYGEIYATMDHNNVRSALRNMKKNCVGPFWPLDINYSYTTLKWLQGYACLAYSSTLKMEPAFSSKKSVNCRTTWHDIPGDLTLLCHCCENLNIETNSEHQQK